MKKLIWVAGLFLVILAPLAAQQQQTPLKETEDDLYQGNTEREFVLQGQGGGATTNQAALLQLGSGNVAEANQTQLGSQANLVIITQVGVGNHVQQTQTGSGNQSSIRQGGVGNRVESTIEGDDNRTLTVQVGLGNQVDQTLEGDGFDYTIIQRGNGNQVIQYEDANTQARSYEVEQEGNGMRVELRRTNIYRKNR